jgi:hypothetical protein
MTPQDKDASKIYQSSGMPMIVSRRVLAKALRDIAARVMSDEALGGVEVFVTRVGADKFQGTCRIGTKIYGGLYNRSEHGK